MQTRTNLFKKIVALCAGFVLVFVSLARAGDLTGTNFIVRDPVIGAGGGYQSSGSFKLYSSQDETFTGLGSSTSFKGNFGFLYYPYVQEGTLTTNLNGTNVDMSWGATATALGFTVSGYKVGKATVSGGPYTYTNVGNVTSYTYTNLAAGTYYFVVETLDNLSNTIAVSNEETETVPYTISFSISDNTIGFGTLSSVGARYATGDTTGTSSAAVAHTMTVGTNASSGYSVSYRGPALSKAAKTISGATVTSDIDGTPGTEQFAIGVTTNGSATIATTYQKSSNNWDFSSGTTTTVATQGAAVSNEVLSVYYLVNIAPVTDAGAYSTTVDYITTANF
ncbi:MAG TPA: hypothetical protein VLB02_01600 [Candidatus Paceibacterota bacterium]|nr:hypothetical protein [Candidatus Paceibacterota bacterium]